ncbi:MAG: hypothetical protein EBR82_31485 [Caulobacteraceae bacterium]|nr:hypothetical protein [Caulobacteraceae bacterium]
MAKAAGRLAVIYKNAVAIAGVQTTTISVKNESIDVTDKDSAGIIEVLSAAKTKQITLKVEGLAADATLRTIAMSATGSPLITDLTFKFADALTTADILAGNFFMTSYEEGNPHDDAVTFSAEFVSSGTWTLT